MSDDPDFYNDEGADDSSAGGEDLTPTGDEQAELSQQEVVDQGDSSEPASALVPESSDSPETGSSASEEPSVQETASGAESADAQSADPSESSEAYELTDWGLEEDESVDLPEEADEDLADRSGDEQAPQAVDAETQDETSPNDEAIEDSAFENEAELPDEQPSDEAGEVADEQAPIELAEQPVDGDALDNGSSESELEEDLLDDEAIQLELNQAYAEKLGEPVELPVSNDQVEEQAPAALSAEPEPVVLQGSEDIQPAPGGEPLAGQDLEPMPAVVPELSEDQAVQSGYVMRDIGNGDFSMSVKMPEDEFDQFSEQFNELSSQGDIQRASSLEPAFTTLAWDQTVSTYPEFEINDTKKVTCEDDLLAAEAQDVNEMLNGGHFPPEHLEFINDISVCPCQDCGPEDTRVEVARMADGGYMITVQVLPGIDPRRHQQEICMAIGNEVERKLAEGELEGYDEWQAVASGVSPNNPIYGGKSDPDANFVAAYADYILDRDRLKAKDEEVFQFMERLFSKSH